MKRQRNLRKAKFSTKHGRITRASGRRRAAPDLMHSRHSDAEGPQGLAMERIAVLHDLTVSLRRMLGLPNRTR